MNLRITVIVCTVSSVLLSSCTSLQTRTAHTTDIQGAVLHAPILADLDVKNIKVTGNASASAGNSIDAVKNLAIKDALKTSNADLLVEPTFESQHKGGKTIVTVTGFPATYQNFHPATKDDITVLDAGSRYITNTAKSEVVPEKKKGAAGFITLGLLAVLFVILAATGSV